MNQTVRAKIRQFNRIDNDWLWWNKLPEVAENINNQVSRVTHQSPTQIWVPGMYTNPPGHEKQIEFTTPKTDNDNAREKQKVVQANLVRNGIRMFQHERKAHVFQIGDECRVFIEAFIAPLHMVTHVRARMKAKRNDKYNICVFSPQV